jgi:hypothetical protein
LELIQGSLGAAVFFKDGIGLGRLSEGQGVFVVLLNVVHDRGLEFIGAGEHASPDAHASWQALLPHILCCAAGVPVGTGAQPKTPRTKDKDR